LSGWEDSRLRKPRNDTGLRLLRSDSDGDGGSGLLRSEVADMLGTPDGDLELFEYVLMRCEVDWYADCSNL
jgi:hypothetical protein